jgi:hypothetical protein
LELCFVKILRVKNQYNAATSLKTKNEGFNHKSGKFCIIFVGKNRYRHVFVAMATTTALLILKHN